LPVAEEVELVLLVVVAQEVIENLRALYQVVILYLR
jgi:hypothetical protein